VKAVCVDVRMWGHSGIGTYIRNLIAFLKESPFHLTLIAHKELLSTWPALAQFNLILSSAPIYSLREQLQLPRIIPPCDLFWSPHYNVPLFAIPAKKRWITLHDVYHLAHRQTLRIDKRIYATLCIKRAVSLSDQVITNSYFSQGEIVRYTGIRKEKVEVIHLGGDHHKGIEQDQLKKIRERYLLPEKFFLFVGVPKPHKNIERLLSAWHRIKKEFPCWWLILVGQESKKIQWNVKKERQLLPLGEITDQELQGMYQMAYATIHPSLYEGFGLTPLEAMSRGCPVIVSHVASLPEVCGDAALYIFPEDEIGIGVAMRRLIENPQIRDGLAKRALERSCYFTWQQSFQKYSTLLEKV